MRKVTLSVIAGNPPATGSHPSGINGMMETVAAYVKHDPRAPSIPTCLFQNPHNRSRQNSHSVTPKNQLPPRMPKSGYSQEMSGPLLIKGIRTCASYSNHFWYPNNRNTSTIDARMSL